MMYYTNQESNFVSPLFKKEHFHVRTFNNLIRLKRYYSIRNLSGYADLSDDDILQIKHCGRTTLFVIRRMMKEYLKSRIAFNNPYGVCVSAIK